MRIEDWFLTAAERGNPAYGLPAWSAGNAVVPHVARRRRTSRGSSTRCPHSSRATTCSSPTGAATPTSGCCPEGPTVGDAVRRRGQARRGRQGAGVALPPRRAVLQRGGEPPPQRRRRTRRAGRCCSTSGCGAPARTTRRLVVVRRGPGRDVAFAGGIDLCHARRDDADHHGDPQVVPMAKEYGERPPWHDVQLELRGPVVGRARRRVPASAGTTRARSTPTTRSPG